MSVTRNQQLEYVRHMGAYKPRFQGKRTDYYPTRCLDLVFGLSLILFLIGCWVGLTVGMIYWARSLGSTNFSAGCSIAAVGFSLIVVIGTYFGSKDKDKRQSRIMREALAKQKQYNQNQSRNQTYYETQSEINLKYQQNQIRLEIAQ